ncbi:MAG: dihydroorotate dehydrogenase electron transfer subunit [Chthonomonadales bacterium]|nr:dihydroorotate dehydrogenase electron transfer subunit [Chthonomonadales bacterium]
MPCQIEARILQNASENDGIYRLRLHAPAIAAHAGPGQFVHVLYGDGFGPLMRRPFSIHDVEPAAGCFDVVYAARGAFTTGMAALRAGDTLSVVGPLGNTFTLMEDIAGPHVLVAGGVGAPPLHLLAKTALGKPETRRLVVINGARTSHHLVATGDFLALGVEVRVTTDDGSAGRHGTVMDELREVVGDAQRCAVYACGPEPMLRAVAEFCVAQRIPCRVSLETVMPCGTGVCMGCVVKVRDPNEADGFAYVRACHDGPVFDAEELLWD